MPDATGLLTQEERNLIAGNMQTKMRPTACPWCGANQWEVGPSIVVNATIHANGQINVAGQITPLVTLISPCGYVAHFAAKLFGLSVREPGTPTPAPAAG